MAKFTGGTTEPIDFSHPDFDIQLQDLAGGTVENATKTQFQRTDAPVDFYEFFGTGFAFAGDILTAGTINHITATQTGDQIWDVSGFSISAAAFNTFVAKHDDQGFLGAVFAGNDSLSGSTLADNLLAYKGNDSVDGGAGNDTIDGGDGNDSIQGGAGGDSLIGGIGNDTIDGGTGDDSMAGGAGNDTYFVDSISDVVKDLLGAAGGIDTVVVAGINTGVLPPSGTAAFGDIENLTLAALGGTINGIGNEIANKITGNELDNALIGNSGNDTIIGGIGNDTLTGAADNNSLDGGVGNDSLDGGDGKDSMAGGAGDDTYVVNDPGDKVTETLANDKGGGIDTVKSSITYTLGTNLDNLLLTAGANINGTGNTLDNVLTGNTGNNKILGLVGNDSLAGGDGNDTLDGGTNTVGHGDTMAGGKGDDTFILDVAADVVIENPGEGTQDTVQAPFDIDLNNDTLYGNIENATLLGTKAINAIGDAGNNALTGNTIGNVLTGNDGNDVLDGGKGNDTLTGGVGDDVYVIDSAKDFIQELGGDKNDKVRASITVDLNLPAFLGIEHVELTGTAALNATGRDAENNILTGNAGNNTLDGRGGDDTMTGGAGNDTYFVDSVKDVTTEDPSAGIDTVISKVTWGLDDNFENLTLANDAPNLNIDGFGNGGANKITGNDGNNFLSGGLDIDTMIGGKGDDTYFVTDSKEVVTESLTNDKGGGIDTVQSIASFVLGTNLDNLELLGGLAISGTGNALNNLITDKGGGNNTILGLAGNDTVIANGGSDRIDGGTGDDSMSGGAGDDTYLVDSLKDIVDETGGSGTDQVNSTVSFSLVNSPTVLGDFENLLLLGSAAIKGTGNDFNNVIQGNTGANTLDGGKGADTLFGGLGNDTYIVDSSNVDANGKFVAGQGDSTQELNQGTGGTDTVISTASYALLPFNENLTLVEGSGAIFGIGNTSANKIIGNSNDNTLDGGQNSDTLFGGGGNNSLTGGAFNNSLDGGDGNDIMDGGVGADRMNGGKGNDIYFVDNTGDVVTDTLPGADGGIDTVNSSVSFTLAATLENLILTGTTPINGTGNALDNQITGNSGVNKLTGLDGNDTIDAGDGNDTIIGGKGNDSIIGGSGGDVAIFSGKFSDYTIDDSKQLEGIIIVTDKRGVDGTDTLFLVDRLQFSDQTKSYNSPPTDITVSPKAVTENAQGAVIGTITVADPDPTDTFKLSLDDARFEIVANQLKLKAGESLDFEDAHSVTVNITAVDPTGASLTKGVVINVTDAPTGSGQDGYFAGATVFTDTNKSGFLDSGEPTATTNVIGRYELAGSAVPIGLVGGTDIATGLAFQGVLRAPSGASVITPLSTLLVDFTGSQATLLARLGLTLPGGTNLGTYDPTAQTVTGASGDRAAFAISEELMNTAVMTAAVIVGFDNTVTTQVAFDAVFRAIATQISNSGGAVVNLADAGTLSTIVENANLLVGDPDLSLPANASILTNASNVIAALNGAVHDMSVAAGVTATDFLTNVAAADIVAQHAAALALTDVANGGPPVDLTPFTNATNLGNLITAAHSQVGTVFATLVNGTIGADTVTLTAANDAYDAQGGADKVSGDGGNDTLFGGSGNDTLDGGVGNDMLLGGWGNDSIAGGSGTDTVVYSGKFADYTVTQNKDGTITVTHNVSTISNNDGTDTLSGIEIIQFADQSKSFNQAPEITGTTAFSIAENTTLAGTITATDPNPGDKDTFSITGGADAALFNIDANTGALTFKSAPDFENPADSGKNNVYDVIVTAKDTGGLSSAPQAITVTVTDANDPPVITSNGGGATANASAAENQNVATTVVATDQDKDAITYSIIGGLDSSLFTIDSKTGVLTFNSNPDFENPTDNGKDNVYNVTVQASDGKLTDTQAIAVTVTNANDAPVFTSGMAFSIDENSKTVTTVFASDQDKDTLTFSVVGGLDKSAFSIDANTGVLSFINAPNFENSTDSGHNNVYDVTVQVSDGKGGVTTQAIAVTVNDINEAPIISSNGGGASATVPVAENSTAVTTVIANDPDAGAAVTYSIIGGDDAAAFSIDASTGALTFVSAPDFELPADKNGDNGYQVIVQASDGIGGVDTQTLAVNVTDVNEAAPVISSNGGGTSATINVAENSTAVTDVNATDADTKQTLTYSVTGIDAGLFTINASTGVLAFANAPDFENPTDANKDGDYLLTVQVSDGHGGLDTQDLTIHVTDANDSTPVITSNGGGPTASTSVAENTTAVTTVIATDADTGPALAYSIVAGGDGAKFAINGSSGVLTFIAPPDFENPTDSGGNNSYVVTVQASDGVHTDTQTITVNVTDANDSTPVITSNGGGATASTSVAENTTAVTTVIATDADTGPALAYSIVAGGDGAKFSVNSSSGVLTFIAPPDFENPTDSDTNNSYVVTVQASDGVHTDTQTITVNVTDANDSTPVITSNGGGGTASTSVAENTTAVTTVVATDADTGPALAYSIVAGGDGAKFSVNSSSGVLTFIAPPDFENPTDSDTNNSYVVTVQASDGVHTDTQTITVNVTDANDSTPVITSNGGGPTATIPVAENTTAVTTVAATDADTGPALAYSIVAGGDGAKFSIDSSTGVLTFTAPPDFEAPTDSDANNSYVVTVQASDGVHTDTQTITVNVTDVNDSTPVITSNGAGPTATIPVAENTTAVTTVTATDADTGPALAYSIVAGGDGAKFAINSSSGVLTFIAPPDFENPTDSGANNSYVVTVQVSDGVHTDTQTITVNVTNANEAPVITSNGGAALGVSVAENTTAVTTITASDPDANTTLAYSLTGTDAALFDISSIGVLTFKTAPDFEAPTDSGGNHVYDLTVKVSDGSLSDTQDITVTVTDVNPENITGDVNANSFTGGAANDSMSGLGGNDTLIGGGGNDSLDGGAANDNLSGGTGDDTLIGGDGNDSLDGGADNNTFFGNAGDDTISGGAGTNTVHYDSAAGGVTIDLQAGTASNDGDGGHDTLTNIQNVSGSSHDDGITGNGLANLLEGLDGNDTLSGGGSADTLHGGAGNDTLVWDPAASLDGGADTDTLLVQSGDLDLTGVTNVTNMEKIDLATDSAANTVTLTAADVLNVADPTSHTLTITGDVADTANIGSGWSPPSAGPVGFVTYTHADGATLEVADTINVITT